MEFCQALASEGGLFPQFENGHLSLGPHDLSLVNVHSQASMSPHKATDPIRWGPCRYLI